MVNLLVFAPELLLLAATLTIWLAGRRARPSRQVSALPARTLRTGGLAERRRAA
jgi:hypothetical protein